MRNAGAVHAQLSPDRYDADGLSPDQVEQLGAELDELRRRVLADRGAADAAYIRRVITTQRMLDLSGRALLLGSRWRAAWWAGTLAITLAKILENMEIGHNVLHGQWDWMRDPKIHSSTWQWDHCSPPEQWQRAHNDRHHVNTNVLGKDDDLGYGILRVDERQSWRPRHLVQPLWNLVNACFFEYGIAMYDLDLGASLRARQPLSPQQRTELATMLRRAGRQGAKDYVVHPALAAVTGSSRPSFKAAVTANLLRNLWTHSVIMCGHFPEGVETFEVSAVPDPESRAQWYLRQMRGSANISGPAWLHLLTGNLSHQIEHHLFPDLPSNRYREIAVTVRDLCARHGIAYHRASLPRQVASAWHKVIRLSIPPRRSARLSGA